ncbi:MAG: AAA family ATPase [Bacteroidales bacterium]
MKLKSLAFRNIGAYGNRIVDIELSDEGGLWFIFGNNGHGKSTLLNMTKALFYGKVDKLKKDEIANRFNKHGWIMGTIESPQGNVYNIERTFSPSNLKVSKDGVDLDVSGISKGQQFIDSEVTQMPYQIYSNIVSLSINDFKSFLVLTPKEKREIIDRIFGIDVVNKMSVLVKSDIKDLQYKIDLKNREIGIYNQNISSSKLKLEMYIKEKTYKDAKETESIDKELMDLVKHQESLQVKLSECVKKKMEIDTTARQVYDLKNNLKNQLFNLDNYKKILSANQCPTCLSDLNTSDVSERKKNLEDQISAINTKLLQVNEAENVIQGKMDASLQESNNLSSELQGISSSLTTLKNKRDSITKDDSDTVKMLQDIITSDALKVATLSNEISELSKQFHHLGVIEKLCGSDGVKQSIIESYLPLLNNELVSTLDAIGFPYNITFDKDFEPSLSHLGISLSPESLSTGERKKVDLAVLIAIIRVMKRKYPHLNLFMLDEVLSSIDQCGVKQIVSFLHDISKELKINIFMVNHAPLPMEYFDKCIYINKKDGFSEIEFKEL